MHKIIYFKYEILKFSPKIQWTQLVHKKVKQWAYFTKALSNFLQGLAFHHSFLLISSCYLKMLYLKSVLNIIIMLIYLFSFIYFRWCACLLTIFECMLCLLKENGYSSFFTNFNIILCYFSSTGNWKQSSFRSSHLLNSIIILNLK